MYKEISIILLSLKMRDVGKQILVPESSMVCKVQICLCTISQFIGWKVTKYKSFHSKPDPDLFKTRNISTKNVLQPFLEKIRIEIFLEMMKCNHG